MTSFHFFVYKIKTREGLIFEVNDINSKISFYKMIIENDIPETRVFSNIIPYPEGFTKENTAFIYGMACDNNGYIWDSTLETGHLTLPVGFRLEDNGFRYRIDGNYKKIIIGLLKFKYE